MRSSVFALQLCLTAGVLSLGGCSLMPTPDPSQAWVELRTQEQDKLLAAKVDSKALEDERFFQVTPGEHELHMRLQFAVEPSNVGAGSEGLARDCELKLDYTSFAAGQRYNLVAGSIGFRPWAKLYDEQHQLLAKARESRCDGA